MTTRADSTQRGGDDFSTRLDRMEAKVGEIHSALLGCVEDQSIGLIGRVQAHSRDLDDMRDRERRRAGWVMTAVVGWVVALGAAGIAWIREHAKQ